MQWRGRKGANRGGGREGSLGNQRHELLALGRDWDDESSGVAKQRETLAVVDSALFFPLPWPLRFSPRT